VDGRASIHLWQINGSDSTLLMACRGAALFLGLAVMLWLVRNAESSPTRRAIAVGFSVSCAALAGLGISDFVAGHAGLGILAAVTVEIMLTLTFALVRHADRPPSLSSCEFMCNLYYITRNVDAIRRLFKVDPQHDRTGNLPPLPGIYPDYPAPIVRNNASGRELAMARWGNTLVAWSALLKKH
jgi:hypothetical protein